MSRPLWGNQNLTTKCAEAQKLKQIMHGFDLSELPSPAVIHAHDPDFKKFNHKSFGNVFQNIKKNMALASASVHGPGIDCEEEGEWKRSVFLFIQLPNLFY